MGFHALSHYAALRSIDPQLSEAATTDEARGWHKIRDLIVAAVSCRMMPREATL
jgi:ABC-type polysaccharide transport system permease subunit